ncbi:MAG: hypothetical protein OEY13_09300 [Gammaproteobacteria bacterium]|nr:hypothetical protein [Gammaproteobacteria bacterium]MDH4310261.1 hypothetical protein [Gammaproteobacteria bacterium]MDH5273258.1 hypothetical protein [Gammaproteobacteria bacterium]
MKCLYYLAPTLDSTHVISDDLHEAGVKDFFVHVVSRDEAGLQQQHIHSSNYLETLDVVRDGIIGGVLGFVVGLIGVGLLDYFDPIGVEIPAFVYYALVGVATLFGAWEGGLIGVGIENRKLAKFHDDIEAGKFLILIYALKEQEDRINKMMRERHPESELVAVDRHFINPFSTLKREPAIRPPADQLLQKE